jgi:DNA-binding transcriptional regulator YiaG
LGTEKDISQLVKTLRERLALTQERLAVKLEVTFTTVNRWENGHSEPSRLALKQIEDLVCEMGPLGADLLKKYFHGRVR